jgi:hypothetical protein
MGIPSFADHVPGAMDAIFAQSVARMDSLFDSYFTRVIRP